MNVIKMANIVLRKGECFLCFVLLYITYIRVYLRVYLPESKFYDTHVRRPWGDHLE